MTTLDSGSSFADLSRYEQAFTDIKSLKLKLPQQAVSSLAREVLDRVLDEARFVDAERIPTTGENLVALSKALISNDDTAGANWIARQRRDGIPVRKLYLTYLAGAAEQLGEWWAENKISLVDVTIGTSRIFAILRSLAPMFESTTPQKGKRAVFASTPDEDHTLGIRMATDLLREEGWNIDLKVGISHKDLVREIGASNSRLIGLSAAGAHSVVDLAKLVIALRISNPQAYILISGKVVSEARELVDLMDADAVADDYAGAKAALELLWTRTQVTIPEVQA